MLEQELLNYTKSNVYPFHMPGHKRQGCFGADPNQVDITEIHGFDNLHEPEGLLLDMMKKAARLYGSRKSFLLVNGSTVGNLAAIYSVTHQGGTIIMGRNCHKSVYHGAQLRQLKICYTNPKVSSEGVILGTPMEEYCRAIEECPDAEAIVVTSPTYEGMVEPLNEIVKLAHKHHMVVIVDGAHGAHFPFHKVFPPSPLESGADIVVMSLHKTLPALTQTALLHVNKDAPVGDDVVQSYLSIFETSSPSYVLLSSIDRCLSFLEQSENAFSSYVDELRNFYAKCEQLEHLRIMSSPQQDMGKIVIVTGGANISGYELQRRLREEDGIELEMASFYYALAMSSVMDTREGFDRLWQGLLRIDATCEKRQNRLFLADDLYGTREKAMELYEAVASDKKLCPWSEAFGKVAGEMVSLYPPGVPVLVPGEVITERSLEILNQALEEGLQVTGLREEIQGEKGILVVVN